MGSREAEHPRAPCGFPDPPSGEATGEFMHERKKLTPVTRLPILRKILAKELKPIWPLFGVVASGFFLAGWIVGRNLGKNPEIRPRLNKERRAHEVPEIDEPELVASLGQEFLERDLLRDVVKKSIFKPVFEIMTMPHELVDKDIPGPKSAIASGLKEETGKQSLEEGTTKARVQT